jgi:hypothetical protein
MSQSRIVSHGLIAPDLAEADAQLAAGLLDFPCSTSHLLDTPSLDSNRRMVRPKRACFLIRNGKRCKK